MDRREYDIVLYGASGFTAGFVIKELEESSLRIAVSARSISNVPSTTLPKIECTIEDIWKITARTKVLVSCVGPYALHGEEIVRACIETGTHYVDICGEPSFLESIYQKYNEKAEDRNVRIIQCCGFDSLPADIGIYMLSRNHDTLDVEVIHSVSNCKTNKTTWDSLILSLTNFQKRSKTKQPNSISAGSSCIAISADTPTTILKSTVVSSMAPPSHIQEHKFVPELGSYVARFRGADPYVIKRSSAFFRKKGVSDVRVSCYLRIGSMARLAIYYILLFSIYLMCKYEWTSNLLTRYPGFFTFGVVTSRPCERDIQSSSFQMFFKAVHPTTQKKYRLRISGPNPGYTSTAIFVTQSAFALVEEEDKIRSGVLTPAIALHKTRIVERLSSKGISFDYY